MARFPLLCPVLFALVATATAAAAPSEAPQQCTNGLECPSGEVGVKKTLTETSYGGEVFPVAPSASIYNLSVANTVTDWNMAVQWVVRESNSSLIANRVYAVTHLAIWRALEANRKAGKPAEKFAVVAYAAHLALINSYPFYYYRFNRLLRLQIAKLSEEQQQAAMQIVVPVVLMLLRDRLDDGTQQWLDYEPPNSTAPGTFRILLPPEGFQGVTATLPQGVPQFSIAKPFILPNPVSEASFMKNILPPPQIPSPDYQIEYELVKELGALNSTLRNKNESNLAVVWSDAYTDTAGLITQWMRVALSTLPKNINLRQTAELLAALACGQFDANVAAYYLKYKYNYWRPVTAIELGDPDHEPEPDWQSYLVSQNNPSYPSKLGAFAGVAAVVLNSYYGKWGQHKVEFKIGTDLSLPFPDYMPIRFYTSINQTADEAVQTRVFTGQEFLISAQVGRVLGEQVMNYILQHPDKL